MNKKTLLYLVLSVVLIGALFVVFLNFESDDSVDNKTQKVNYSTTNWEVDLSLENKNPYGLFAFKELTIADGSFSEFNTISDYYLIDSIAEIDSSMLMFVGLDFMLTDDEVEVVLESVNNGNHFFVSAQNIPSYLLEILFKQYPINYYPKDKAPHKINGSVYDMYYFYENDTLTELWEMFDPNSFDASITTLSTIYGRPNYIEIQYGLGKIFIHLNPLVFTNVQLLKKDGKSYLKEVLAELNQPKIQWLTFAKFEPKIYDPSAEEFENEHSLLSELFKHPAFRWGFIMAIFGLMLYLLFRSKRSRPIIPAVEDNKNTGFSYVDTLAGIYFNKDHGDKILKIMKRNFYSAVYAHFYIDLAKREDKKPLIALSKKSNVSLEEIVQLIKFLEVTTKVSDVFLSNTYKLQRSFYLKSGIWNEEVKKKLLQEPTTIYRQKQQALVTLGIGVFMVILGFLLLTVSIGVGVLFWPLGAATIAFGTRMLNVPLIKLHPDQFEIYPIIGKKQLILHENIKFIEEKGGILTINFKNGGKTSLNISQLNSGSKKSLDHLKQRFKQH